MGHADTSRTGGTGTVRPPPLPSAVLAQGGCLHRKGKFIAPAGEGWQEAARPKEGECGVMLSGPPPLERGETHEHNQGTLWRCPNLPERQPIIPWHAPWGDRKDSRFSRGTERGGWAPGAVSRGETLKEWVTPRGRGGGGYSGAPLPPGDVDITPDCAQRGRKEERKDGVGWGGGGEDGRASISQGGCPRFPAEEGEWGARGGRVPRRGKARGGGAGGAAGRGRPRGRLEKRRGAARGRQCGAVRGAARALPLPPPPPPLAAQPAAGPAPRRHGQRGPAAPGLRAGLPGLDRYHHQHRHAPVEDGILRGGQHRDGPGALRGAVDVVRHAEHGADPVQGVRLAAQTGE